MPRPTDKTGVQRILGVLNYVSKFIPNISVLTAAPIRQLLLQETEWHWHEQQEKSFQAIKQTLAAAPGLEFYDPKQELTLQIDAGKLYTGLGSVLIQNNRPHPLLMLQRP